MLESSYLVRPNSVYKASYLEALREGFALGISVSPTVEAIAEIAADFAAYLRGLDHDGQQGPEMHGQRLPGVPSTMFWLVDGPDFIGGISIRARIDTELLAHFGGHIGFGIRPSRRRQGYGTRQLGLALEIARGMGIGIVRISCAEDNDGSRRIIEANAGILLRRCEPGWYSDKPFLLFEIPLLQATDRRG